MHIRAHLRYCFQRYGSRVQYVQPGASDHWYRCCSGISSASRVGISASSGIQEVWATHFDNPFALMVGPSSYCARNGECSAVSQKLPPSWHFFIHTLPRPYANPPISANFYRGFSLADSTAGAIGIAIAVIIMISATLAILWLAAKRDRSTAIPAHSNSTGPPSISLSGYNTPHPDRDGYTGEPNPPRYDGNGYSGYPPRNNGNASNSAYNGGNSGYTTPPNGYRSDVGVEQQAQGRVFV